MLRNSAVDNTRAKVLCMMNCLYMELFLPAVAISLMPVVAVSSLRGTHWDFLPKNLFDPAPLYRASCLKCVSFAQRRSSGES